VAYIDEVIDPDDTRKILFQSLALLIHKKSTRPASEETWEHPPVTVKLGLKSFYLFSLS